jgi:hypothetical protein
LAFDQGALLSATSQPQAVVLPEWLDFGDWQSLAAQVGAETIFFVDRDPVVVFARSEDGSPYSLQKLYDQIWCMSRPQLLFLATRGQLAIYDLAKPPPKPGESLDGEDRLVDVAKSMEEVQSKLAAYHRERVETGAVFGDDRFRDSTNRADRALIRDLKIVRRQLEAVPAPEGQKKPKLRHLHSLIGRAIFVRYLEDREILVPAYFESIAGDREAWQEILVEPPAAPALDERMVELRFLRVLRNKEFTYALFEQLAGDFNGDIFPIEEGEVDCIRQEHLDELRGFLMGSTSRQKELFFFAYRFDVIPIELISAIYEEFYTERIGKSRSQGSHYTPPALVEFVLQHTLTPEVLAKKPRVFDPACGSGIFLVESFRRMVRHAWREQNGRRLSCLQLRKILREQIAGIDVNEEAVRVAAFSLYLAFLHYQKPREINDERRLPYLKRVSREEPDRQEEKNSGAEYFDVLLHANAFEAVSDDCLPEVARRFGPGSADIVVGNPPWGYPKKDDKEGQKALAKTLKWCDVRKGRPVGDKELSQAFIHLSLVLLRDGGTAGLLVSSGVFFKHHENSRKFRRVWLNAARLEHVVNFAHVRHIFFSGPERKAKGISPFVSVVFERLKAGPPRGNRFEYWSAKRTAVIENTRCVVLNRGDMHWLSQRDCLADERLWKIYWWGGHRDDATIRSFSRFWELKALGKIIPTATISPGRGFKEANKSRPAEWLKSYRELPTKSLRRYGPHDPAELCDVPDMVERRGVEDVYHGHRLLVGRGIKTGGFITARLETEEYAFRNSINGVRFEGLEPWQEATIIGIFWSSLARYYYFLTSGAWGLWHDEIHLEDVEQMPICLPSNTRLRDQIARIVNQLQQLKVPAASQDLLQQTAVRQRRARANELRRLEDELDAAIFELYELSPAERDAVHEMCSVGLDLFYRHHNGDSLREVVQPRRSVGTLSDLPGAEDGLSAYLRIFIEIWNGELAPDGELAWRVLSPPSGAPLLAVSFMTRYRQDVPPAAMSDTNAEAWSRVLARLQEDSLVHGGSSRIFIDTFFRYIGDREILFIKRNERRFWTRTAAREDAESALAYLMNADDDGSGGER